jgi:hypothetical protein
MLGMHTNLVHLDMCPIHMNTCVNNLLVLLSFKKKTYSYYENLNKRSNASCHSFQEAKYSVHHYLALIKPYISIYISFTLYVHVN